MSELERHRPAAPAPGVPAFVEKARNAITVKRVFGDPIERDGVVVIPAAHVSGGGGGGGGTQPDGNIGSGGGFGVHSRPAGALVVRDGEVQWVPARDPERRLAMYVTLTALALLFARTLLPRRRRRR